MSTSLLFEVKVIEEARGLDIFSQGPQAKRGTRTIFARPAAPRTLLLLQQASSTGALWHSSATCLLCNLDEQQRVLF